jgi:hypothetical protein
MLVAGGFADSMLSLRLIAGQRREDAAGATAERVAARFGVNADVRKLIACWHAYRLLQGGSLLSMSKLSEPPMFGYGHYWSAWSLLLAHVAKKDGDVWALPPGLEDDCRAAYVDAAEQRTDVETCADTCKGLVARWASVGLGLLANSRSPAAVVRHEHDFDRHNL